MSNKISPVRLIIAGIVAVVADVVQWLLIPAFSQLGFMSPANDILDFAVAGFMYWLLGFHWVLLPTLLGELVPIANMMPFWSGAVFFVAIGNSGAPVGGPGQILGPGSVLHPHVPPQPILPSATVATPAAQPSTDVIDDKKLNPFFREIEPK
ncbi:MAG: hypothetical protein WCT04_17305 [Planctomycetota bacterium]